MQRANDSESQRGVALTAPACKQNCRKLPAAARAGPAPAQPLGHALAQKQQEAARGDEEQDTERTCQNIQPTVLTTADQKWSR
eukprot:4395044-Pyramimonas_sp.AAC.1